MRPKHQIALFLLLALGMLAAFAFWNQQQWTAQQKKRFSAAGYAQKLSILFENGHISPRASLAFYRRGISVQPRYAVVGKHGWLYLGDKFESVASRAATGTPELDAALLTRWTDQVKQRQDWLQAQRVRSLFVIAPNKHSVYPENSPDWLPFTYQDTGERLTAAAERAGVRIVNTTPAIRAEKCCRELLYNRTDSHWTAPAAFTGYTELMRALAAQDGKITALSASQVAFKANRAPASGLARMLRFDHLLPGDFDRAYALELAPPAGSLCVEKVDRDFEVGDKCVSRRDDVVLPTFWEARKVTNPDALNDLSVLVVQDSFGMAVSRYFTHSFTTVWHAHLGYILNGRRLRAFVRRFQPDIVVYLVVERNLLRPQAYEFDDASGVVAAPME